MAKNAKKLWIYIDKNKIAKNQITKNQIVKTLNS